MFILVSSLIGSFAYIKLYNSFFTEASVRDSKLSFLPINRTHLYTYCIWVFYIYIVFIIWVPITRGLLSAQGFISALGGLF